MIRNALESVTNLAQSSYFGSDLPRIRAEPFLKCSDENQHGARSSSQVCPISRHPDVGVLLPFSTPLDSSPGFVSACGLAVNLAPAEAHMAWGVKRTKLEEMLDEKRQEVASLSPQRDAGRLRQLEREIRYLESMLR